MEDGVAREAAVSSPMVWERPQFVTAVGEGSRAWAKAVGHTVEGREWVHKNVAGDKRHAFKLIAADARTHRILWVQEAVRGTVMTAATRRSSFAGPTPVTDGKKVYAFGPEGLYAYEFTAGSVWRVVEKFPTLGLGTGTSPVLLREPRDIQRDEDPATTPYRRLQQGDGEGGFAAKRNVEISWGTPVIVAAAGRQELVAIGKEGGSSNESRTDPPQREGAAAHPEEREQCDSHATDHDTCVIVTAGYPAKEP